MANDNEEGISMRKTVVTFCKPDIEQENKTAHWTKKFMEGLRKSYEPKIKGKSNLIII